MAERKRTCEAEYDVYEDADNVRPDHVVPAESHADEEKIVRSLKTCFLCKTVSNKEALQQHADMVGSKHKCLVQCTVQQSPEISLTVMFDAIENVWADVIVNSTNKNLILNLGNGVSTAILKAGGNDIQKELSSNYPGGIQVGGVARSGPGNIKTCKAIYHGVLPQYRKSGIEDISSSRALVTVVLNSLLMASSDGFTSVAFPVLGTGVLGYPVEEVVQLMFSAVTQFCAVSPIQKVFFVIFPKQSSLTKKLFLMEKFSSHFDTVKVDGIRMVQQELEKDATKMFECRIEMGNILLQICNGRVQNVCDVTRFLIVLWQQDHIDGKKRNPLVSLFYKHVQDDIYRKYGPQLKRKQFVVDDTSVMQTSLLHLYCKKDKDDDIAETIAMGIDNLKKDTTTIAILSEGSMLGQFHVGADIIIKATRKLKSLHHVVRIIIEDRNELEPFLKSLLNQCRAHVAPNVMPVFDTIFPLPYCDIPAGCSAIRVTSQSKETNEMAAKDLKSLHGIKLMAMIKD